MTGETRTSPQARCSREPALLRAYSLLNLLEVTSRRHGEYIGAHQHLCRWALLVSNQRPPPCKGGWSQRRYLLKRWKGGVTSGFG